ncbi:hypothetical protein FACS189450_01120 [Spirochaetia bacterium]|nr:hypothetical protein FACS189450_01120 [Spirochaetia bacterium]
MYKKIDYGVSAPLEAAPGGIGRRIFGQGVTYYHIHIEIKHKIKMGYGKTAHNIRYTLRRSSGLAYEKPQSAQ